MTSKLWAPAGGKQFSVASVLLAQFLTYTLRPILTCSMHADPYMASVVRLKYGDTERSTRLVNNQLHIPTVKDMFGLSSVDIDGVAEPADDRGFTFASYMSGSILEITGTPAQAAVLSGLIQLMSHDSVTDATLNDC